MSTNELLYHIMLMTTPKRPGVFTMDYKIDNALKQVTGFTADELQAKDRRAELTESRHIGLFFYIKAGYSTSVAAMRFHRDHATAIHARDKVKMYYGTKMEQKLTDTVNRISELTGIKI
jgi:chromosomal replication initiation ATPase DnaA